MLFACAVIMFVASFSLCQATPIPGINIVIKRNPGGIITRTTSDAKGAYTFKRLPPGRYTLSLTEREVSAALRDLGDPHETTGDGIILKIRVGSGEVKEYTLRQACAGIEVVITGGDTTVQEISGEVIDTLSAISTSRSNIKR
jgi:hypothetical protein